MDYHNTPSQQTFTAVKNHSRAITANYTEIIYGCYCVDSNMVLWKKENWQSSNNAIGVALINDNVSMMIALDEWYCYNGSDPKYGKNCSAWGGQKKDLSIPNCEDWDYEDIIQDYNGEYYTSIMFNELESVNYSDGYSGSGSYTGSPAARYCVEYSTQGTYPGDWWLGSMGHWWQVLLNQDEISACLSTVGGMPFRTGLGDESVSATCIEYATSNESFASRAIVVDFENDIVDVPSNGGNNWSGPVNNVKYKAYVIRPFTYINT